MARPSSVDKLPLDIRNELRMRLRGYDGDYLSITAWLNDQGYGISKSAVGRYAIKLRRFDEKLGMDREIMSKQGASLAVLFEELATLKQREAEIIAQIKTATLFLKQSVQS